MDPPETMVDAELILRFQQGRESAFETLVRRHMKDAYQFCLGLTGDPREAEEISQEGFVSVYRGLRTFRGESSFRSWLFRILINLNRDRLRTRRRYDARLSELRRRREGRGDAEVGADRQALELSEVVREKIDRLPARQREVLLLHLYRELGYREIADVLGIRYEAVKMNLSLARKRLREELKEYV
ncbi:MAG: RNA polymerase sigma factor [Planctomycetota bacterium]|jgi:RNA polymerase sigma-70 factor (ECF subfamily)